MSAPAAEPFFSAAQRRLIAATLALVAAVLLGATIVGLFVLLQRVVSFFSGVLWPLVIAGVLALMLRPVVSLAERRLRLSRLRAVLTIYGVFLVMATGALTALIPILFEQALNLRETLPASLSAAREVLSAQFPTWYEWLREHASDERLRALAEQGAAGIGELASTGWPALREAGAWVTGLMSALAAAALVPIYLFFFLLSEKDPIRDLEEHLVFIPKGWRSDVLFLVREFVGILGSFFQGQMLIGLIMGVLLAVGFTAVGLPFGVLLGLLLGALNIVPYLGTIIGLGIVLPLAWFQPDGGLFQVGAALLVFVLVQLLESYVLTPKIMGQRTGLHPLAIIIAIFFWGTALQGLLGMILAVPLTAFFVVAWRLLRRKILDAEAALRASDPAAASSAST